MDTPSEAPPAYDLITLSTKISELGTKLEGLRAKRLDLDNQISELEQALVPLVTQHTSMMATIMGRAMPAPIRTPQQQQPVPDSGAIVPSVGTDSPVNQQLKQRVMDYLKHYRKTNDEEGASAQSIAEALHIDSALVRECFRELARIGA